MAEDTSMAAADPPRSGIYLSDVLGMLRRRWIVVLVGLVLVVGAMGAAYLKAPTSYQSTGQLLLLLPPQASGSDSPTNPYLNLDPGLATAAALIASTLNAPESQRSVAAAGHTADYSIALSPETGPLLVITTEGPDPQQAIGTRDEVIRRLQDELQRIQTEENAPRRQFIHTRTNGTFNEAEVLTGDRTRAVAAVGAAGLLLTLMIVVGWDRWRASRPRRSRAERRNAKRERDAEDPEPEENAEAEGKAEAARTLRAEESVEEGDAEAAKTIKVERDERRRAGPVPARVLAAEAAGEADSGDHPPDRALVTADDHGASRR